MKPRTSQTLAQNPWWGCADSQLDRGLEIRCFAINKERGQEKLKILKLQPCESRDVINRNCLRKFSPLHLSAGPVWNAPSRSQAVPGHPKPGQETLRSLRRGVSWRVEDLPDLAGTNEYWMPLWVGCSRGFLDLSDIWQADQVSYWCSIPEDPLLWSSCRHRFPGYQASGQNQNLLKKVNKLYVLRCKIPKMNLRSKQCRLPKLIEEQDLWAQASRPAPSVEIQWQRSSISNNFPKTYNWA